MGPCLTFRSQVQPADLAMLRKHVPQLLWLLQAEELHGCEATRPKGIGSLVSMHQASDILLAHDGRLQTQLWLVMARQ